jgi:hypothetical protein
VLTLLVLGIFLAALAGGVAARRTRRRLGCAADMFRCRLRIRGHRSAHWPRLGRHWSRPMWARWDDDVLTVRRGPGLARAVALPTAPPADGVRSLLFEAPRLCGPRPIGVVLSIRDGSRIEVAASADDRMTVVGPYLVAAINDLPEAPLPRRHL